MLLHYRAGELAATNVRGTGFWPASRAGHGDPVAQKDRLAGAGPPNQITEGCIEMRIETTSATDTKTARLTVKRRGLAAAGALALLAGSLAFAAPAFAQDEADPGEMTEGTTVTVGDSEGTAVETAASGEAAAAPAAPNASAAPQTAAAPAAGAATAPTTLPRTGVGDPAGVPLPLIGLAAAGAVAAGAVAVNRSRPAAQRAELR